MQTRCSTKFLKESKSEIFSTSTKTLGPQAFKRPREPKNFEVLSAVQPNLQKQVRDSTCATREDLARLKVQAYPSSSLEVDW